MTVGEFLGREPRAVTIPSVLYPFAAWQSVDPAHGGPRAATDAQRSSGAAEDATAAVTPTEEKDAAGLDAEARAQVRDLAARDREVRDHEMAHVIVGGPYAGAPSYEYTVGPDQRRYAVAGEVPIDASPVEGDPEATIAKMRIVAAAALAPPQPSATDRAVAALADARALQARAELDAVRNAETRKPEEGLSVRL